MLTLFVQKWHYHTMSRLHAQSANQPISQSANQLALSQDIREMTELSHQAERAKDPPKRIKGRVVDKSGQPIPFATVKIKGTAIEMTADENGYYSLPNPWSFDHCTLLISSSGYGTQETTWYDEKKYKPITKILTDEDGEPLIGATIQVKGTDIQTKTDIDGNYTIPVPRQHDSILIVSYTGYATQELSVSKSDDDETQHRSITGTATDEYGEPLIGAVIQVKGTDIETKTDFDGNYAISGPISRDSILLVSYTGYAMQEVTVGKSKVIDITIGSSPKSGGNETQHRSITGTATDEYGEPFIGAVIQVKGTDIETKTDFDGNYAISGPISHDSILLVSYTGYAMHEVSVGKSNILDITIGISVGSTNTKAQRRAQKKKQKDAWKKEKARLKQLKKDAKNKYRN